MSNPFVYSQSPSRRKPQSILNERNLEGIIPRYATPMFFFLVTTRENHFFFRGWPNPPSSFPLPAVRRPSTISADHERGFCGRYAMQYKILRLFGVSSADKRRRIGHFSSVAWILLPSEASDPLHISTRFIKSRVIPIFGNKYRGESRKRRA